MLAPQIVFSSGCAPSGPKLPASSVQEADTWTAAKVLATEPGSKIA